MLFVKVMNASSNQGFCWSSREYPFTNMKQDAIIEGVPFHQHEAGSLWFCLEHEQEMLGLLELIIPFSDH